MAAFALSPFNRAGEVIGFGAEYKQGTHQQVHRNGRITRLHLGHTGLAKTQPLGQFDLRQASALAAVAQTAAQCQLQLDECGLGIGQTQELLRRSDGPPSSFEFFSFVFLYRVLSKFGYAPVR